MIFHKLLIFLLLPSIETGRNNLTFEPNIIHGHEVVNGEIPYQAMLLLKKNENLVKPFCGGSIITVKTIVTAAHCCDIFSGVKYPILPYIAVGGISLSADLEFRKIKEVIIHPEWNKTGYNESDLGLLLLFEKLPWTEYIKPVELAEVMPSKGSKCKVSGWGLQHLRMQLESSFMSPLMASSMTIAGKQDCVSLFSLFHIHFLNNSMICAVSFEGSPCMGDSGGPLVCDEKLVGVVSWGIACSSTILPSVYTDVSFFHEWIVTNMDSNTSKFLCNFYIVFSVNLFTLLNYVNLL